MSERANDQVSPTGATTNLPDEFFECTYCTTAFEEWPGGCPECGGIVVRVVDPGPIPDQ